jgi:SAM-dependent methyltransferase
VRNPERWQPSKYVYKHGRLIASRDPDEVNPGSRLVSDLIAEVFDRGLKENAAGRLLDLGCGKVPLYEAYRSLVTESVCVDWSRSAHGNDHLDHEIDLTEDLPFGDNEFDTIVLSDVLEHIPVPERLWGEMARVLAASGKIIVSVPFYYWLHEAPHDYYRYTEFALRRFVEVAGLELVELKAIGGAPEILTDILAKNFRHVPMLGHTLATAIQWCTLRFVRTGLGRKVSQSTSRSFPLGYFLVARKP